MIMDSACSLLHSAHEDEREFEMGDYQGPVARWCAGCGDHSVLTSAQRLLAEEQLKPETTVFVSGIGCSSRFPHYMKTYGFHGIHGRALPVATGVKLTRPDLDVFVVMGDGDCVSIGAGHWIHAIRYNVDMVALLLDNNIYGLTKKQTSPTTPQGYRSNTQPRGSYLPAMNPLEATLGVTNASFVAQTAEWVPAHLFATLKAAHAHKGFAFVRILQRCPHFTPDMYAEAVKKPDIIEILDHPEGIRADGIDKVYKNKISHDPLNLNAARELAQDQSAIRLGLFFRDESYPRYEETRATNKRTAREKMDILNEEFDSYAV
ncbi:MAG: thiamine pyrophosphate-dependent enzyme [Gemmatimonadota bacterium]|nr:thiamine pyrophosphate-dependent enzyme [Gemmatimonadota bacterium]MDH5760800.1 thiamine pyrophosphate-dependent enzyme [Gemmatimonadota bacterium]